MSEPRPVGDYGFKCYMDDANDCGLHGLVEDVTADREWANAQLRAAQEENSRLGYTVKNNYEQFMLAATDSDRWKRRAEKAKADFRASEARVTEVTEAMEQYDLLMDVVEAMKGYADQPCALMAFHEGECPAWRGKDPDGWCRPCWARSVLALARLQGGTDG